MVPCVVQFALGKHSQVLTTSKRMAVEEGPEMIVGGREVFLPGMSTEVR